MTYKRKRLGAFFKAPAKKRQKTDKALKPRFNLLQTKFSGRLPETRTIMRYYESVTLNPAAGVTAVQVFAANDCFKPDVTSAGHQANGFDQYMALYTEFVVVGSTVKVTYANSDISNDAICGVSITDLATTSTSAGVYIENGNTQYTSIGTFKFGCDVKSISLKCDMYGYTRQNVLGDDTFYGTAAAGPAEKVYFQVWVAPYDGTTDIGAIICNVEIAYDVVLRNIALTAQS